MNECKFSEDRLYRYSLLHSWEPIMPPRCLAWIGLNPSTADEDQLDPTLRRVKAMSAAWGFNCFVMLNLFAFRATDPREMLSVEHPIGEPNYAASTLNKNDSAILWGEWIADHNVIVCWGAHGSHRDRDREVMALLRDREVKPMCLGITKQGLPRHPLYLPGNVERMPYNGRP